MRFTVDHMHISTREPLSLADLHIILSALRQMLEGVSQREETRAEDEWDHRADCAVVEKLVYRFSTEIKRREVKQ